MTGKFDIIEFLSGLTNYVFDKAVLKTIALYRGVAEVTSYDELDKKTLDLLEADLLYKAYYSPNVWASSSQSHGSYTKSVGHQTFYIQEKERVYKRFTYLYKKYNDDKLEEIENSNEGNLQWINPFEQC
jgi:hypothetical protein